MKKMKLILNESLISNKDSDIIEDTSVAQKPDYQIIDITVIPDEDYYPTIQSILIDLDEGNNLMESENSKLDINILSETVNQKTGYSNSLFEFESSNHTITLSLVLQETDKRGVYKIEAYTTRGVKIFESVTYKPRKLIESYLNSIANEYLIDKPLKEAEEDILKDDVKKDLAIEPGSDEEAMLDEIYEEPEEDKYYGAEDEPYEDGPKGEKDLANYSVSEFTTALALADEVYDLNIDYSNWNDSTKEQREELVKPEMTKFVEEHREEFDTDPKLFELLQYNLTDANFHTEAKVMRDLYRGGK